MKVAAIYLEENPPEIDIFADGISIGFIENTKIMKGVQIEKVDSKTYKLQFDIGIGIQV